MTQNDLNRAVADATGENLSLISRLGFTLLSSVPARHDPEERSIDWDDLEAERNVQLSRRRRRNALNA